MKSQNKRILEHLLKGRELTAFQALEKFSCLRLAARINDIRNMGFDVKSKMVDVGTGKSVAQYSLEV